MVKYKKSITRILVLSLISISFLIADQLFFQKSNFIGFNPDLKLSYTGDSKIEMVNWESQNLMVEQNFIDDYSVVDIDINVGSSYNFSFKLSDANDVPITNSIVWMHIQFLPGMPLNLIYSKPLIYPVAYGPEYYGPYWWVYGLTDGNGTVTFEITFNHDYLADFFDAFGTTGISSIEDIDLYIRVFSSNFLWADMAISNPSQYLCSTDGNIFNGTGIIPGYDFTNLSIQDPTYMHGRIHFHKGGLKVVTEEYYILKKIFDF